MNSLADFFKTEKGVDLEVLTTATLSKLEEIKEKTATGQWFAFSPWLQLLPVDKPARASKMVFLCKAGLLYQWLGSLRVLVGSWLSQSSDRDLCQGAAALPPGPGPSTVSLHPLQKSPTKE